MNDPLVSIIIPLYNNGHLLGRCLDSILSQPFDGAEIIIIDDGSTDDGFAVASRYADKFENVSVLHRENGGVSAARNLGMTLAHGKYLAFADPDDLYAAGALDARINELLEDEARYDIISCGLYRGDRDGNICDERRVSSGDPDYTGVNCRWIGYTTRNLCSQFYRRDFIERYGIRFPEKIRIGEDSCFVEQAYFCADSCLSADLPFYIYTYNKKSVTARKYSSGFEFVMPIYKTKLWDAENLPKMRDYGAEASEKIRKYYRAVAAGGVLEAICVQLGMSASLKKCGELIDEYGVRNIVENYSGLGLDEEVVCGFREYAEHPRRLALKCRAKGIARSVAKAVLPEKIKRKFRK